MPSHAAPRRRRVSSSTSSLVYDLGGPSPIVIDLDADAGYESDSTELGDEELQAQLVTPTTSPNRPSRQIDPFADAMYRDLRSLSINNRTYKLGKTAELQDGQFLRITAILEHRKTKAHHLQGLLFRRNKSLGGILEYKRNEVTMILKHDSNDARDIEQQSIHTVGLDDVVGLRELVLTNQLFPAQSFRTVDQLHSHLSIEFIETKCRLVCRWKFLSVSKNEGFLIALRPGESDSGHEIDTDTLRFGFRGHTTEGGARLDWAFGEKAFDRAQRRRCKNVDNLGIFDNIENIWKSKQRYEFGDAFCGAGGASMGAKAAGLSIGWGFDFDPAAVESYCRNFFNTRCEAIAAHDFVNSLREDFKVDILHLSPPCQTFAPCHTRPGQNDEMNEATFTAIEEIVKKTQPRIVTLEETFGLTRTLENLAWFNKMVQMLSKLGFSVRWKVFNLCDYGLPQPRRRLIVLASCPAEVLPSFPPPTHCKSADLHLHPHLKPYTTVAQAIANIPANTPLHNPTQLPVLHYNPPYDADLPLRSTITCAAGAGYHPSGKRAFTLREVACLQGFPLEHRFGKLRVRRQIGNALPPVVGKVFFEAIVKALKDSDGVE